MTTQDIGKRIARRRKQLNITQSDLAEAINVSYQQVQKYETGITNISVEKLIDIAVALKMEVAYFFETHDSAWKNVDSVQDMRPPALLTREELLLLKLFRNSISPEQRRLVLNLVHEFAEANGLFE